MCRAACDGLTNPKNRVSVSLSCFRTAAHPVFRTGHYVKYGEGQSAVTLRYLSIARLPGHVLAVELVWKLPGLGRWQRDVPNDT